jgi:hypothetical protein
VIFGRHGPCVPIFCDLMFLKQELCSPSEFSIDQNQHGLSIVEQNVITIQIYIIYLICIMHHKHS